MLAAHALATKNRAVRELGRSGVWVVAIAVMLLSFTFLLPLWATMAGLGVVFGQLMPNKGAEAILGTILFAVTFFGGAMSGAMGGAKQLAWESYRTYPVRTRSVFIAELLASMLDIVPIVLGISALMLLGGLAIAVRTSPWLFPVALFEALIALLVIQLLVGTLAERLVRRLRVGLSAIALAVWVGTALTASIPKGQKIEGDGVLERAVSALHIVATLGNVARALPSSKIVKSLYLVAHDQAVTALELHLYPVLVLCVLVVVASRMVAREMSGTAADEQGSARLWTFRTPAWGIARLTFLTVMQSRVGRFGLVVPILVIVLVRGPLAAIAGQTPWTVPGSYAYLSLVANQFQLNQFGLDGHGVKALLLLPISERDVLAGKARGLLAYQTLAALLLTVLFAAVSRPSVAELASGLMLFYAIVFMQNAVGRRTSVTMPRMTPRKDVRANATPIALVLVGLLVSIVGGSMMSGLYVVLAKYAAPWLPVGMAALTLTSVALHRLTRDGAERLFRTRREKLLEVLG